MSQAKRKLKIGLLGFGAMGKTHAYCIHNLPYFYPELSFEAEVAGVVTTSLEKSKRMSETYRLGSPAENEDVLICDPNIDIIDICTPNHLHYETLKKVIRAGKAVYCEKPLCTTAAEAWEIANLAEKHGVTAQIVFNNQFLAPIQRAGQLVAEGRLGRILSFRASYLHNSALDVNRKAGWKQDRSVCGGGVLFDLGSHAIGLIHSLCGEFATVSGTSQIAYPKRTGMDGKPWETNADEAFYLTAQLKNGAFGTITASKLTTGSNDDLSIDIYGEKGALHFSLMEPNWLYFYDATAADAPIGGLRGYTRLECVGRYPFPGGVFPSPKAPRGWLEGHIESMMHFLTCVANGTTATIPNFFDAAHVQSVMEAAYKSDIMDGRRQPVAGRPQSIMGGKS